MTTIAYKNGIMAVDSLITYDNVVRYNDFEKFKSVDGHMFFLCGEVSDWDLMIETYFKRAAPTRDLDCSALVWDGQNMYMGAYRQNEGFWKELIPTNSHMALGSGTDFALMAMDLGQSAAEAVGSASRRCIRTGGILRTFDTRHPERGVVSQGMIDGN